MLMMKSIFSANTLSYKILAVLMTLLPLLYCHPLFAAQPDFDSDQIDDAPKILDLQYPEWFSQSFLDIKEDLSDAKSEGKKGIIVYFGQKDCGYCKALLAINFGRQKDIVKYTREHFNVIAINIKGSREVTDIDGQVLTETQYAEKHNTQFTPSLLFYLHEDKKFPKESLRLNGYHPPYAFNGALKYLVNNYYQKESLKDYLERADPPGKFELSAINEEDFFIKPPLVFDRRHFRSETPLVIFFEQGNCHACDILHTEPIQAPQVQELLSHFEVAQLDAQAKTPIITPSGEKITAQQWAKKLNVFYYPTLILFDEQGKEIIRIDSVAKLYRLRGVLDFVHKKAYLEFPNYQRWRESLKASSKPKTVTEK